MILAVHRRLNFEDILRIAGVLHDIRRQAALLEQGGINLLIGLCHRIVFVYNVKVHVAIVGVNYNFYRISDIVGTAHLAVIRLRVRIIRAGGICVQHPVKLAVSHY